MVMSLFTPGPSSGNAKWQLPRPGGNLQSRLSTAGYLPSAISAFNNATLHTQVYRARMNTFEANRRWWAWDVFSVLIGLRGVDYREYYGFFSQSAAGSGYYEDLAYNRMFGPQIGGEVNQAVGLRTLLGFKGKAALLANFSKNSVNLQNAGINILVSATRTSM